MTADADRELVLIGRVVKAHGIRGEVVVESLSDVPGRFAAGVEVEVGGRARIITTSRPHQGRVLLAFDEVTDRSAAERLRGQEVRAAAVPLESAETYFAHELVGLPVEHIDGRVLGEVSGLIELPDAAGYDLLEVSSEHGTWLLPAADGLAELVERAGGSLVLVVDPPEGLVDGEPEG
ncbi:MAG: ribosome maturation factor RimM [Nitriliruptoraceae bacterium]